MRILFTYVGFLLLAAAVASSGIAFQPGAWYAGLEKPAWTPPDIVFPIVWTIIYILVAIAGARAWLCSGPGRRGLPFLMYGLQMIANAAWSWLFFGLHFMVLGMADILLLLALILGTIWAFRRIDGVATFLMIPYAFWVIYAATLNGGMIALN